MVSASNIDQELGWCETDFKVIGGATSTCKQWAAPEFLEQAGRELIEEEWKRKTTERLPQASELQASSRRLG